MGTFQTWIPRKLSPVLNAAGGACSCQMAARSISCLSTAMPNRNPLACQQVLAWHSTVVFRIVHILWAHLSLTALLGRVINPTLDDLPSSTASSLRSQMIVDKNCSFVLYNSALTLATIHDSQNLISPSGCKTSSKSPRKVIQEVDSIHRVTRQKQEASQAW